MEHRQFLDRIVDLAAPDLDPIDHALLAEIAQGDAPMRELASVMGHNPAMLYKRRQRLRRKLLAATRFMEVGRGSHR